MSYNWASRAPRNTQPPVTLHPYAIVLAGSNLVTARNTRNAILRGSDRCNTSGVDGNAEECGYLVDDFENLVSNHLGFSDRIMGTCRF